MKVFYWPILCRGYILNQNTLWSKFAIIPQFFLRNIKRFVLPLQWWNMLFYDLHFLDFSKVNFLCCFWISIKWLLFPEIYCYHHVFKNNCSLESNQLCNYLHEQYFIECYHMLLYYSLIGWSEMFFDKS